MCLNKMNIQVLQKRMQCVTEYTHARLSSIDQQV